MSITSALNNAMSGLRAAGRTSETISANLANAMTPGYGVRNLSLSSAQIGGVKVDGVLRNVDPRLLADTRLAEASFVNATDRTEFLNRLESMLGTPDEASSLAARLSDLESSLVSAVSRPDAPERLQIVANSARDLATMLSEASDTIQRSRSDADRQIQVQVDRLNYALGNVRELNTQITRTITTGADPSALMDNRQAMIDEISAIVPIRQVARDNGQVALYSTGGAILLDGSAAEIAFSSVNQVTPYMSLGAGTLSGLTVDGYPVRTDSLRGALSGGSLGAQFEIRDELGPEAQAQLDALARDLVERFQDPAVDSTLAPGDAGLFTDAGIAFDPLNEVGLSSRIRLNTAVDEQQGGEAWRIRDGLNAALPGEVGDARRVQSLKDALTNTRVPASGDFGVGAFSAANLFSTFTSQVGSNSYQAERQLSFASTQFDELKQQMLANGVDSDAELQRLMIVEQAYAANVKLIQAADDMLQTLLRI